MFEQTLDELVTGFSSLADPKFGLIAGLNCRVLGEDATLFVKTFCNNALTVSFLLAIIFGVVGYLILFISCCSVCLGVRHYKKQEEEERKQRYYEKEGVYPGRAFSAE